MVINSTLCCFYFCPFCEFQIIEVLPCSFPSLWPVCVNLAGLQKWGEEVVMTALSAPGEEFLCGAVGNGLCARVQFNLGWGRVQSGCDWHPQEPPCKAGKLKLHSGPSANSQPLFWEIAPIWSRKNVSIIYNPFLGVFMVPVPLTFQLILQVNEKWQEGMLCEQKQRNGPLRLCQLLSVLSGTWSPGRSWLFVIDFQRD